MTLNELVDKLHFLQTMPRKGDWPVMIETDDPYIGPTPMVGIRTVRSGFDWDGSNIIITTLTPIIHK